MRWVDAYFPFTDPSYELEIFFNGEKRVKEETGAGCGLPSCPLVTAGVHACLLTRILPPHRRRVAGGAGVRRDAAAHPGQEPGARTEGLGVWVRQQCLGLQRQCSLPFQTLLAACPDCSLHCQQCSARLSSTSPAP